MAYYLYLPDESYHLRKNWVIIRDGVPEECLGQCGDDVFWCIRWSERGVAARRQLTQ